MILLLKRLSILSYANDNETGWRMALAKLKALVESGEG
jgi:hypothetical protein